MASAGSPTRQWRLPLFEAILPIDRVRVPTEIIAGVTLAALAIPEVMGYTKIAGLPVITGLYTILLREQGILLALVLSLGEHLYHSYRPFDRLVVLDETGQLATVGLDSGGQAAPGLAIYRFGASLYYANASRFTEEILAIADRAQPPLRWMCVAASAIGDVDLSASEAIRQIHGELARRGVMLVVCDVDDEVKDLLDRYGLTAVIGPDHMFAGISGVLAAYEQAGAP